MSDELNEIQVRLLEGMREYLEPLDDEDEGPSYTLEDVEACRVILDDFRLAMSGVPRGDDAAILATVRRVVERLNELNVNAGEELIETDQREDLCALILAAARQAGLETDEDVTEEWREW